MKQLSFDTHMRKLLPQIARLLISNDIIISDDSFEFSDSAENLRENVSTYKLSTQRRH